MIWLSVGMALAATRPITLDEASTLGPADRHRLVPECDCVRASWDKDGDELVLELPRAQITAVVQSATSDGQQDVSLRVAAGADVVLQRAPCPPSQYLAAGYASLLQISRIGDAADTQCNDIVADVADYEKRRFTHIDQLEVSLVSLAVTDRKGDPLLDVQRGLSGSRALLAHCFVSNGTPTGSAQVRFIAGSDGTLTRVKASRIDDEGVGACLATSLERTHLSEVPATDVKAIAAITLP